MPLVGCGEKAGVFEIVFDFSLLSLDAEEGEHPPDNLQRKGEFLPVYPLLITKHNRTRVSSHTQLTQATQRCCVVCTLPFSLISNHCSHSKVNSSLQLHIYIPLCLFPVTSHQLIGSRVFREVVCKPSDGNEAAVRHCHFRSTPLDVDHINTGEKQFTFLKIRSEGEAI